MAHSDHCHLLRSGSGSIQAMPTIVRGKPNKGTLPVKHVLAALVACSMLVAPSAFAGGWGHGHGYYWGGYHHHSHNDAAAYLVGGLLVGGLVTNAYYAARPAYVYPASTVMYREATYAVPPPVVITQGVAAPGHHLLRDLEGRCYERSTDSAGNELRTELPPSACNW